MKIKDIITEDTGVGGIAVVAQPMNIGTIRRPGPSIYASKPTKKKKKKSK